VAIRQLETRYKPVLASGAGLIGGLVAIAAFLICALNPENAAANTLEAGSSGYPTISAAVQAASPDDTILIHAGTYREQVDISKPLTLEPFGDGRVIIDGECQRDHGVYIGAGSGTVLQGISVKRTVKASILIDHYRPDVPPPSNVTIDGMTLQDFDCRELSNDSSQGGVASYYGGSGMRITNNLIQRRAELPGSPQGYADGIWFKSGDANPSGGGHYIAGNTIIGGWDGIGGEEEFSAHGAFDKNTVIENNTIRDCWDDGIQVEGGGENIHVAANDISGCGDGAAFAAVYTGPLYIENNYVHDLRPGLYGGLFCFKTGNSSAATVYLTGNICDVDSPAEVGPDGGADGIHQTNSGMFPIVSRNNTFHVGRYVFEIYEPYGSYDYDCMATTDPTRFVKWGTASGTAYYYSLAEFQAATGQEPNGQQTTDCSFLGKPAPTPDLTPPPRITPRAASETATVRPTPGSAEQTPVEPPLSPEQTASSDDNLGTLTSPLAIALWAVAGLILSGLGFVGGVKWSQRGRRRTP
jgi:parallel beta-helix repeat protein